MQFRIRINDVDYAPDELYEQTPFEATLLREVAGPDRPDYCLAQLAKPLRWVNGGSTVEVTHVVLAARWVGGKIDSAMHQTPVNIAYVLDPEVLREPKLDLHKCAYVAIGSADAIAAV